MAHHTGQSMLMLYRMTFVALFAAFIAVSGIVAIPAGPLGVPIVMQNMVAVLAGAVLGNAHGAVSVFLFLLAGLLGLPVFSGGSNGLVSFMGPTGGFLVGYLPSALVTGLILGAPRIRVQRTASLWIRSAVAIVAGFIVVYLVGLPWLLRFIMYKNALSFSEALPGTLAAGLIPFIPGAILKIIISVPLSIALRPIVARYINPNA